MALGGGDRFWRSIWEHSAHFPRQLVKLSRYRFWTEMRHISSHTIASTMVAMVTNANLGYSGDVGDVRIMFRTHTLL